MAAQPFARFDPAPRDPGSDPACSQPLPIGPRVIRFVSVQFGRTAARASTGTTDRRDGIDHFFQHGRLMRVGTGVPDG
jgi:hypothetical protein